jgi:hypothetical protein
MKILPLLFICLLVGCGHYYGYMVSHDLERKHQESDGMRYEYNIKTKSGVVVLSLASSVEVPVEEREIITVHIINNGADFVALYQSSDGQREEVIRHGESKKFRVYPPRMGFTATTQRSETPGANPNAPMKMQLSFSGLPKGLEKTNLLEKASQ